MFGKLMVATAVMMLVTATADTAKMEEPAVTDKLDTVKIVQPGPDETKLNTGYIVYTTAAGVEQAEDAETEVKPAAEEIFASLYPGEDYDETINVLAKLLWGEARGVRSDTNKACVIWCILNRADRNMRGETIIECAIAPNQFCYHKRNPVRENLKEIAEDVLNRWLLEKTGETNVGRVLPQDYCFFSGDGRYNVFRDQYIIHGSNKLTPIQSEVYEISACAVPAETQPKNLKESIFLPPAGICTEEE